MMPAWRFCLSLFAVLRLASGTSGQVPGITYFLATCGGQNCDTVCGTFGYKCARTGQSFPPDSALPIFESLGISCKTINATGYSDYQFEDSPNYVAMAEWHDKHWVGVCLGFKNIPSTIDCQTANNTFVRRLCPCYDPSVTQAPVATSPKQATTKQGTDQVRSSVGTAKPPTTATTTAGLPTVTDEMGVTSRPSVSTAIPPTTTPTTTELPTTTDKMEVTTHVEHTTAEQYSTENEIGTGLPQQQLGSRGESERTALIVVTVFAVGLLLCLLGVAFMFLWNRRQLRGKRGKKPYNEKLHVGYHKNNNKNIVPDMIDGLAVETDIDEENSYCEMKSAGQTLNNAKDTKVRSFADDHRYENTCIHEKVTENILYASSIPEGTNMALVDDNNIPLYDRLV